MKEPMVFIPGVGGGSWLWEHQLRDLSDVIESQVIVLDQQETREEMVRHVLDSAPASFSLAGHSLGGWVAQAVAARAQERVRMLFLCDTWTRDNPAAIEYIKAFAQHLAENYDGALDQHFGEFLHEDRYADQQFCERLSSAQRIMPAAAYRRQLHALARDYSTLDLLPLIRADTLVIRGRQDRVIAAEECRELIGGISHASLALIERSGHVTPMEQPEAFTAVMRLWLERRR